MIRVIIPVLNEEKSIAAVLKAIPSFVAEVIVVDNGCTDGTAGIARALGATVIAEPRRGYGSACLRGIAELGRDTTFVVFMDGDFSDFPEEMANLLAPLQAGKADLAIGSRVRGNHEQGALLPVARFGNWLSTGLIRLGWGHQYTDLGPFRAIAYPALKALGMRDPDFGWTVEMQIKALTMRLCVVEIPVSYRKRMGTSKISGSILGSCQAGRKILTIIGRELFVTFISRFDKSSRPA